MEPSWEYLGRCNNSYAELLKPNQKSVLEGPNSNMSVDFPGFPNKPSFPPGTYTAVAAIPLGYLPLLTNEQFTSLWEVCAMCGRGYPAETPQEYEIAYQKCAKGILSQQYCKQNYIQSPCPHIEVLQQYCSYLTVHSPCPHRHVVPKPLQQFCPPDNNIYAYYSKPVTFKIR